MVQAHVVSVEEAADVALSQADALMQAGRPRAAINLLEQAGRDTGHPGIAQRLLDARVDAFEQLTWPEPAPQWPPSHDERYRDEPSFPEISLHELSADALKAGVIGKGGLIVRELMPPALIEVMRSNIDRALEARRQTVMAETRHDTAAWFNRSEKVRGGPVQLDKADSNRYSNSGSVWCADSPRMSMALTQFYHDLGLPELLAGYFNEAAVLSVRKWVLRCITPNNGRQAGWHQDGRFLGDPDIRTVNLWIALTDCGEGAAAPGLELVGDNDGTIYETGTQGADFDWTVSQAVVDEVIKTHPVAIPSFRAGDAIFFDHFNLHRTAFGSDHTQNRYAIESWFFAGSSAPLKQQPLVL